MTLRDYVVRAIEQHWNDSQNRMAGIKAYALREGLIKTREYDGMQVLDHLCWVCDACGHVYYNAGSNRERLRGQYSVQYVGGKVKAQEMHLACRHCQQDISFQCSMSGQLYSLEDFTPVRMAHGKKQVCLELYGDRLAKHPDGCYVDTTIQAGYHHGYRSWRRPERVGRGSTQPRVFGVELEILCSTRKGAMEAVRKAAIERGFAAERDGSLDGDFGIEIVAPPLSYADATNASGDWCQFLGEIQGKATGWDAGINYGMHVNLDTRTFSIIQLSKFVNFINHNGELIAAIAGRTATKHCQGCPAESLGGLKSAIKGHHMPVPDMLENFNVKKRGRWLIREGYRIPVGAMPSKYYACAIRDEHRVEVRSFRSTIRWDRFKRNIQFCDSLQSFVQQAPNRAYLNPSFYLDWLSQNQHQYPELSAFMYSRPKWSELMTCEPNKKVGELSALASDESDAAKPKEIKRPGKPMAKSR